MSAKTLLLIGIFCAVIAYVMVMDRGNQRVIATPATDGSNNFYMQDFMIRQYDESGALSRMIVGDQMTRETDSGISQLQNPSATIYEDALPAWKLDSETGTINADQTEMTLFENVTVVQQPTEELELQTEQLDINLVDQTASSAEKVVIMHTSGRQEGVGMTAELKRNELRLLSQVKGNYAQPQ